jgi:hypothetical protein
MVAFVAMQGKLLILMSTLWENKGQIGLFIHISAGGIDETKTVGALFFRIVLTLLFALFEYSIVLGAKILKP